MTLTLEQPGIGKQYFADKFLRLTFLIGALFNSMSWLWLAYRTDALVAVMPLHYNIYYGIDSYGPWIYIFIMPLFGLAVLVGNAVISFFALRRDKLLSYLLTGTASLVQLVILLASFAIVAINI